MSETPVSSSSRRPPALIRIPDALLRRFLILCVRGYQVVLGPLLGGHCRFVPSCSEYALDALRFLPSWKAVPRILWRVARCQPLCKGGFDFVAPAEKDRGWALDSKDGAGTGGNQN